MENHSSKQNWIHLALVSLIIAVGLHTYLTFQYYDLKFGLTASESICNINATFNCDAVSASGYSSLLGVPMALWGAVTNCILLILLFMVRLNLVAHRGRILHYSYWISGFIALTSVVMGLISFFFISALCLFCIGAYLLSFSTFLGVAKAQVDRTFADFTSDAQDLFQNSRWVSIMLLAIPAFAFLFHNMIQDSRGADQIQVVMNDSLRVWNASPTHSFDLSTGLSEGAENPKMTIVEFADFRCSHCKHAAPTLKAFVAAHPSSVRLVYKPFPLDGTCNPSPNMQGGDGVSCGLAKAALCAEQVAQKGWPVHDYLYDNQQSWGPLNSLDSQLSEMATKLDFSWESVKACMDKTSTTEMVSGNAQEGLDAEIRGTPTIFVNGKRLPAGQTLPVLRAVYDQL